jgi:hypothetical protein
VDDPGDTQSVSRWLDLLATTPDIYPHKLDTAGDLVLLVRTEESAYHACSFLDDRFLVKPVAGIWTRAGALPDAVARVNCARPLHFIFHTGHVGSTLVSRLLDETAPGLPLREPLPLRTIADIFDVTGRIDERARIFTALWSRGYPHTAAVVLKATSSAGRIAAPLLALLPTARAIYLNLRPEPYLATLLAGENSRRDLQGHAAQRRQRLATRCSVAIPAISGAGELAAMSWLVESWSQVDAVSETMSRVLPVDFESFLHDPPEGLAAVLNHFTIAADPRAVADIGQSRVLTRYSKAQEYEYSTQIRTDVLAQSRRDNAADIASGLAWLEKCAQRDPGAARVLDRVSR